MRDITLGLDKPPADLAARVHEMWVRFARTSNPGRSPYDSERRATMRIDAERTQVDDPRGPERQAWRTRRTHRSAHPFADTP